MAINQIDKAFAYLREHGCSNPHRVAARAEALFGVGVKVGEPLDPTLRPPGPLHEEHRYQVWRTQAGRWARPEGWITVNAR